MYEPIDSKRYSVVCDSCNRYIHPRENWREYEGFHYCSKCLNVPQQKQENEKALIHNTAINSDS